MTYIAKSIQPLIVGIGGAVNRNSSTDSALRVALAASQRAGARVRLFGGEALLQLPHYPGKGLGEGIAHDLLTAMRSASGLIIASPGYHGSISGLVKNGLDYLEETSSDSRAYLDGLPVGLVATAHGWQASVNTLAALRTIVHALRGWPTAFGAAVNSSGGLFKDGKCTDEEVTRRLALVGQQVYEFACVKLPHTAASKE